MFVQKSTRIFFVFPNVVKNFEKHSQKYHLNAIFVQQIELHET